MILYLVFLFLLGNIKDILGCVQKHLPKPIECREADTEKCILEGVGPRYFPVHKDPLSITEVAIQWSKVPIVNVTLCQTFPNTEKLNLGGQSVEEILENAFYDCKDIKHIFLGGNQIKKIHAGTFKENKRLTHLWLYMNELHHLDPETFVNNVFLEHLYLSSNKLQSFPPELFKPLTNIRILTLHHNRLKDLDVFALLQTMPYLSEVQIRFNQFDCEKLKYIMRAFQARNVYMGKNGGEPDKYFYSYYKNTECIRRFIRTRAPTYWVGQKENSPDTIANMTTLPKDVTN